MRNSLEASTYPYDLGRQRMAPEKFSIDGRRAYVSGFRAGLGLDFGLVLPLYKMPFDAETYDAFLLGAAGFSLNSDGQPSNASVNCHTVGLKTLLLYLGYPLGEAHQKSRSYSELDLNIYRTTINVMGKINELTMPVEFVQPVTVNILPKGLSY